LFYVLLKERGKELKVPYYASAAAARNSNLPHVTATCHMWRQYALYSDHLPLFSIITTLILTYFNLNLKYIIKTGLSNYILGGVLL